MIKTILIDDEVHCLNALNILLSDYCPQVKVMAQCLSSRKGLEEIEKHNPELVFLDIEMPFMNGFELLEKLKEIPFSVIFTTGYDQYAIKAIRFSALDYLLKPIDHKELIAAIEKVQTQPILRLAEQYRSFIQNMQSKEHGFAKISMPILEGFELIVADQVIRCEADDNYTYLYLTNKKKVTVCRTLKEVEEHLDSFTSFIRVHHSYIANLNEVTKYVRGDGGYLVMSDESTIPVSRSRKDALLARLGG